MRKITLQQYLFSKIYKVMMFYYISRNFSHVAFRSMKDLIAYNEERKQHSLGSTIGKVDKYSHLPKNVKLINMSKETKIE